MKKNISYNSPDAGINTSLSHRATTGALWNLAGVFLRTLLQFGAQVLLARMLGPEQFGIFAIGFLVVTFSTFFSDIGIAYGMVQKKVLNEVDVRFVFTWQVLLGALVSLIVFIFASNIAAFFNEGRAALVIKQLSVVILINSLAAPSLNLLKRGMDFKAIQVCSITSYFIGYFLVGIPLAFTGFKVGAIVAAFTTQAFFNLVLLYSNTRHSLKLLAWYSEAAHQLIYGITVMLTNLTNWGLGNIDRVVIGRFFSSTFIGYYATTWNFVNTPTTSLISAIQGTFFSASAKVQEEKHKLRRAFLTLLNFVPILVAPVFVCLAAIPDTVIEAIYGEAWASAAPLLRPLALIMPFNILLSISTPILWNTGSIRKEFAISVPFLMIWVVACYFSAAISLVAVAWTVLILNLFRGNLILFTATRDVGLHFKEVLAIYLRASVISLIVGVSAFATDTLLKVILPQALLRLAVDMSISGTVFLLVIYFIPRVLHPEVVKLIAKLASRLPSPLQSITLRFIHFNNENA